MSEGESETRPAPRRRAMVGLARVIIALRYLIVPAWIVAAFFAATRLPSIFAAETGNLGNLLPSDAPALVVEREALQKFRKPFLSRTLAVTTQERDFTPNQVTDAARFVLRTDERPFRLSGLRALPLVNVPGVVSPSEPARAFAAYLYIDPALTTGHQLEVARRFAAALREAAGGKGDEITGQVPAGAEQAKIGNDYLIWLELATVALVILILAGYFRAVGVPLLGIVTVGIAYLIADHVLGWGAEHFEITIPEEVDPVIIALLFGTLTDYVVFFVSGWRRRLAEGMASREAVVEVTAELVPVILTAALMIAGATLTLLLSGVKFLASFGPGLSVSVLIGASVAITFIPSVLAIFGPALLWPRGTKALKTPEETAAKSEQARLVGGAAAHPVVVTLLCVALLGAAASGIRLMNLGNPVIRGLPSWSEPREGYEDVSSELGPGVIGPTMLVLEEPGIARRRRALDGLELRLLEEPGVSAVIGPVQGVTTGRHGVFVSPDGNAARLALILGADPSTGEATAILSRLEQRLPETLRIVGLGESEPKVTGDTTIASELNADTKQAFLRVSPAALAVLLILLWALLRSRTAPLYLLAVSVMVVAAAIGLTVYVFQGLLDYGELAFFVPVAAAILLLALGSDYNVFLISRIWREAERRDLRPAIRTAGSRAARAITVAGLTLALSFAAVALVPILSFRELAFAMSVGLLLDTLVARTLLIPALVSLFGRGAPSNLESSAASLSSSP